MRGLPVRVRAPAHVVRPRSRVLAQVVKVCAHDVLSRAFEPLEAAKAQVDGLRLGADLRLAPTQDGRLPCN